MSDQEEYKKKLEEVKAKISYDLGELMSDVRLANDQIFVNGKGQIKRGSGFITVYELLQIQEKIINDIEEFNRKLISFLHKV